ncbi:hypothetical protein CJF30_00004079 [Rutstroemia sp. NJR-2017a BBW]|nr:hypothetical protein CJF30_00004079 [Rutstroemia sp. NJR-2017a BBW]
MASKKGAYDTKASDTDFRKKYDRAEYAEKAKEREAKEKEEGRLRYEAKLAGKKYYAPLTGDETLTQARANRLDVSANHLRAIGQTGEVQRAGVEDVRRRIDEIWERIQAEKKNEVVSLGERLEGRRVEEEKEREERRQKRKELVEKRKEEREQELKVKKEYGDDVRVEGEHDEDDMMASMGIIGFGSSKK